MSASITDPMGTAVADVAVLVSDGKRTWNFHSDDSGKFNADLPGGSYTVTLEKTGFMKSVYEEFRIDPARLDYLFQMEFGDPTTSVHIRVIEDWEVATQSAPNIGVSGQLTPTNVKRGRIVQGTVTMDIPAGYHVNSNRPLERFLVATQLQIEAPGGFRVGPVLYPRPVLRTFKFSKTKVSVYEGRAVMRFSVGVPASAAAGGKELKARLRYQSCNNEVCFPPQTREVSLSFTIN